MQERAKDACWKMKDKSVLVRNSEQEKQHLIGGPLNWDTLLTSQACDSLHYLKLDTIWKWGNPLTTSCREVLYNLQVLRIPSLLRDAVWPQPQPGKTHHPQGLENSSPHTTWSVLREYLCTVQGEFPIWNDGN
jgi:hypothetical protein